MRAGIGILFAVLQKAGGNQRLNNHAHGVDGPLKVSDAHHPICDASRAFLQTLQALKIDFVPDVNGRRQQGVESCAIDYL